MVCLIAYRVQKFGPWDEFVGFCLLWPEGLGASDAVGASDGVVG